MEVAIRDLGVIGDRRTCAMITTQGEVVWFCPHRFDKPSIFSRLIDPAKGGFWTYNYVGKEFLDRDYQERSALLTSRFRNLEVIDFMPLSDGRVGICRIFSKAPADIQNEIFPKPFYGLGLPEYEINEEQNSISISRSFRLSASHPLTVVNGRIRFTIPKGEKGWAFLSTGDLKVDVHARDIIKWKDETLLAWKKIASQVQYKGKYENEVNNSLRAIQLMTFQENGGIIAAATTSLPEVPGEHRNYDYRYVWLRDSAMITGALLRADSKGEEERKFLSFLCDAKFRNSQKMLLPFYSLDKLVAQPEEELPLAGYQNSRPVRTGNNAMAQLQLDANANVLLAAKLIYERFPEKDHWETVSSIAEELVERWKEKDHGIWEETAKEHFTSSKVIVAKALEFISEYTYEKEQKERWINTAKEIRKFINKNCLTKEGAYATFPGSEKVDITAALFPVWLFAEPDSREMKKTIALLENNHREGQLYRRTLVCFDASREGVFLAGCFWMAQYYLMIDDLEKAEKIIEAALKFSNDLGFFSEEGNVEREEMLGNFPQSFVHASFIGTILDLKKKTEEVSQKGQR